MRDVECGVMSKDRSSDGESDSGIGLLKDMRKDASERMMGAECGRLGQREWEVGHPLTDHDRCLRTEAKQNS